MWGRLQKVKLSHKLLILFLFLIVQACTSFFLAGYLNQQKQEVIRWYAASNQLNELAGKIEQEIRLVAGASPSTYDQLVRDVEKYDQLVQALADGGVFLSGDQLLSLSALNEEQQAALYFVVQRWEPLKKQVYNSWSEEENSLSTAALSRYVQFNGTEFLGVNRQYLGFMGREMDKYRNWSLILFILLFVFNAGTLVAGFFFVRFQFVLPLNELNEIAGRIQKGKFHNRIRYQKKNEIGRIAQAFRAFKKHIEQASEFIIHITEGKLDTELIDKKDSKLNKALIHLRAKMQKVEQENFERHWTAEGLARFSELLRKHNNGVESLSDHLLEQLVPYLGANQGAIFILDESGQEMLQMTGCYAFDKKKYMTAAIRKGDGLIGQAFQEKNTVYVTDIPEDYIHITSGLGEANPRAILIVPMKINEEVHGILEFAAFNEFKPYQVEFLEKLGESIASTLSMVKVNAQTKLLLEESRTKTEQLHAQEEELRQNMEELQAQQEEMRRTNLELQGQQNALNNAAIVSEADLKGRITYVNEEFCRVSGFSQEELVGVPHNIVRHPDMPAAAFKDMWATIGRGNVWKGKVKNRKKDGGFYWVDATITPVMGENGKPMKYIGVRYDITEDVLREQEVQTQLEQMQAQEEELRQNMEELHAIQDEVELTNRELSGQQAALNNAAIVSETDKRGNITYVNEAFCEVSGYSREELVGQNHRIIRHPDMQTDVFKELWQTIAKGNVWSGEIKNRKKDGGYYWVQTTVTPVMDQNGKPVKFVAVRFDITHLKDLQEKEALWTA